MRRLILSFKGKTLKSFSVRDGETLIGRDPECQIHIDSLAIGPRHARVRSSAGITTLEAIPQAGEVRINGQPIETHTLQDGDEIQIGKHTLTFSNPADVVQSAPIPAPDTAEPIRAGRPPSGWLQILSGSHVGRTFPLERGMTRIGRTGVHSAVIARRADGYFLTHLEGAETTRVDGTAIGEESTLLASGAMLEVGDLRLQFFLDVPEASGAVRSGGSAYRTFSRVSFDGAALLRAGGSKWEVRLVDISLKGALLERPGDWDGAVRDRCVLELLVEEDRALIRMETSVARIEQWRIGLHCEHIDLDSIAHLRRLVELNLGDEQALQRELSALG